MPQTIAEMCGTCTADQVTLAGDNTALLAAVAALADAQSTYNTAQTNLSNAVAAVIADPSAANVAALATAQTAFNTASAALAAAIAAVLAAAGTFQTDTATFSADVTTLIGSLTL